MEVSGIIAAILALALVILARLRELDLPQKSRAWWSDTFRVTAFLCPFAAVLAMAASNRSTAQQLLGGAVIYAILAWWLRRPPRRRRWRKWASAKLKAMARRMQLRPAFRPHPLPT
jgi:drug/metabolite transporter (DMT)-like permease